MIRQYTRLRVADNTGARTLMCITVIGRSQSDTAEVGDVIVASGKQALPNSGVKKGGGVRARGVGTVALPIPLHVSNVMVVCPSCDKPTRVAHGHLEGDEKRRVRVCKHCGEQLEVIK